MALRGGRKIVVRDQEFRWVLSGKGDSHWGGAPVMPHVAIQQVAERPGAAMVAYLKSRRYISEDAHDPDIGGVKHQATVAPQDISTLIERALDAGWNPASKTTYCSPSGIDLGDYTTRDRK